MARALRCAFVFFGCVFLATGCVPPSWTCATNADCNVGSSCVDGACEPAPLFDGGVDGGSGEDAGEPAEDAGESTDGGGPEVVDRDPADGGVPGEGEGEGEGEGPLDDGRS